MFKLTTRPRKLLIITLFVLIGTLILILRTVPRLYWVDNVQSEKYQLKRPPEWAISIEKNGLPNFHKVSQDLYRGAQPTAIGVRQLKDMGIKTIINLRSFHSDRDEIGNVDIGYVHIYMKTWHPEKEEIVNFLKIVTDKSKTPVFVHCQHGADRTGLMCAIYRVAVCGWSKKSAVDEMIYGGYGFHPIWKNLSDYFMSLDIEKMKNKAGSQNLNSEIKPISQNYPR